MQEVSAALLGGQSQGQFVDIPSKIGGGARTDVENTALERGGAWLGQPHTMICQPRAEKWAQRHEIKATLVQ